LSSIGDASEDRLFQEGSTVILRDLWDINIDENFINESAAILYYYRALVLAKLGRV